MEISCAEGRSLWDEALSADAVGITGLQDGVRWHWLDSVQATWPETQSACSLSQALIAFSQQLCPFLGDARGVQQALAFPR